MRYGDGSVPEWVGKVIYRNKMKDKNGKEIDLGGAFPELKCKYCGKSLYCFTVKKTPEKCPHCNNS